MRWSAWFKNPEVQHRIASDHKFSREEQREEYKKIVQHIFPFVGDAGVSIEAFTDLETNVLSPVRREHTVSYWPDHYLLNS
jgi:hypothetical protein